MCTQEEALCAKNKRLSLKLVVELEYDADDGAEVEGTFLDACEELLRVRRQVAESSLQVLQVVIIKFILRVDPFDYGSAAALFRVFCAKCDNIRNYTLYLALLVVVPEVKVQPAPDRYSVLRRVQHEVLD